MLKIRFFRTGKKNQPFFKIVVTDKRKSSRGGSFVEELGFYNPLTKEKNLKAERVRYWLSVGAKPSDTVYNLLIKEEILEGKKIPLHKKKKTKPSIAEAKKGKEEKPAEEVKKEQKPEEQKESTPAPAAEEEKEKPKTEEPKKEEIPPALINKT